MRTAILLPGYLRFYKECYSNFQQNIIQPFKQFGDVDLFVSTWKNIDTDHFGLTAFKIEHGVDIPNPELDLNDFIDLYKPTEIQIDDFNEIKPQLRLENFCDVEEAKKHLYSEKLWHDGVTHVTCQYRKIYDTNKLKQQYEQKNGFKYDFVLKYRSDALAPKPIPVDKLIKDKLYLVDFGRHSKMCADSVWLGSSNLMDYICNIYEQFPIMYSNAKELGHGFAVEKMLYWHLRNHWKDIERLAEFGLMGEKWKFYGRK